jgi:hypothetical protein
MLFADFLSSGRKKIAETQISTSRSIGQNGSQNANVSADKFIQFRVE